MYVSPALENALSQLPNYDEKESTPGASMVYKHILTEPKLRPGIATPQAIGLWLSIAFGRDQILLHIMPCYVDHYWNHVESLPAADQHHYDTMEVIASDWQVKVLESLAQTGYGKFPVQVRDYQLFTRVRGQEPLIPLAAEF